MTTTDLDPIAPPSLPTPDDEVWYTRCGTPTTFALAHQRGALEAEFPAGRGLRWLPLQSSTDVDIQQSHFTHRKERSFRHGGNVPAIWARSRGTDTRLLGVNWPFLPQPILALPASGIESPADLRGRRLLVVERPQGAIDVMAAVALRAYDTALRSAGLTLDDVTLVRVAAPGGLRGGRYEVGDVATDPVEAVRASTALQREVLVPLLDGSVDAVVSQGHAGYQLAALTGAAIVFDPARSPDPRQRVNNDSPEVLTVSGRFLEEHPEVVIGVVARLLESHRWASAHQDEAVTLLAREFQASEELVRTTYGDDLVAGLSLGIEEGHLAPLRSQVSFLHEHGFIPRSIDIDGWLEPTVLEQAERLVAERAGA